MRVYSLFTLEYVFCKFEFCKVLLEEPKNTAVQICAKILFKSGFVVNSGHQEKAINNLFQFSELSFLYLFNLDRRNENFKHYIDITISADFLSNQFARLLLALC